MSNMIKQALCVDKADVWKWCFTPNTKEARVYPFSSTLYGLNTFLADRATCETDPTKLQLIPYVVCTDSQHRIFTYTRGNATGEERLRAKLSIGIGGHVDEAPLFKSAAIFETLLKHEAAREIKEEIGIQINPTVLNFDGFIYEEVNEVGKVHLGLLCGIGLSDNSKTILEEGHIDNGEWLTVGQLLEPENFGRLEDWSKAVIASMASIGSAAGE